MEPFEILPIETIRAWVKSLIRKRGRGSETARNGATLQAIAEYMDIPLNSLKAMAYYEVSTVSPHRQRYFSKVIAMVENGQLDWIVGKGRKKIPIFQEAPKPLIKYQPVFSENGVSLKAVDRPRPALFMPKFKDIVLK